MKTFITFLLLIVPYYTSKEAPPLVAEPEYLPVIYLEETVISVSKYDIVNDTSLLVPEFKSQVAAFLSDCQRRGIKLVVLETWRTPERQEVLKNKGRSTLSGGHSKHQHCLAIDVVPVDGNRFRWKDKKLWAKIGKIGEKHGMLWGGKWRKLYDPGHFEYITPLTDCI